MLPPLIRAAGEAYIPGALPEWADDDWAIAEATRRCQTAEPIALKPGDRVPGSAVKLMQKCIDVGTSPFKAAELMDEHWDRDPQLTYEAFASLANHILDSRKNAFGIDHPMTRLTAEECFECAPLDDDWRLDGFQRAKREGRPYKSIDDYTKALEDQAEERRAKARAKNGAAESESEDGQARANDGAAGAGEGEDKPKTRRYTALAFKQQRVPTIPVIDGLISAGGLYTLTGGTGSGKTGVLINMALAVAFDRPDLIGREVEPGRVLYLTAENPNKFRDRLILAALEFGIPESDLGDGRLQVMPGFATAAEMLAEAKAMAAEAEACGGRLSFNILDTLQSYFPGDDFNGNAEVLKFMRSLRPITEMRGEPTVLVAAHPVKGATTENLVPYGGGAILNEIDGNFTQTASPDGKTTKLHWFGKLREADFEPIVYVVDMKSSPELLDGKRKPLVLPLMRPGTQQDSAESDGRAKDAQILILELLLASPQPSAAAIARLTSALIQSD